MRGWFSTRNTVRVAGEKVLNDEDRTVLRFFMVCCFRRAALCCAARENMIAGVPKEYSSVSCDAISRICVRDVAERR